eukprot:scaffold37721_cov231-Skeletonema_marinoi.AAC.1
MIWNALAQMRVGALPLILAHFGDIFYILPTWSPDSWRLLRPIAAAFDAQHGVVLLRGLGKDRKGMPLVLRDPWTHDIHVRCLGLLIPVGWILEVQCNTILSISFEEGILNQAIPSEISKEVVKPLAHLKSKSLFDCRNHHWPTDERSDHKSSQPRDTRSCSPQEINISIQSPSQHMKEGMKHRLNTHYYAKEPMHFVHVTKVNPLSQHCASTHVVDIVAL